MRKQWKRLWKVRPEDGQKCHFKSSMFLGVPMEGVWHDTGQCWFVLNTRLVLPWQYASEWREY